MPHQPDELTLRLRGPDRRSPAELVALALRELARRPAPTRWDVQLSGPDRALASFRERYPAAAERFHAGVLWSAAHGHRQPAGRPARRPCGWDLARAHARQHRLPAPRVDEPGRLLLGDPCPPCALALGWRPPAKPKPKPKARVKPKATPKAKAKASAWLTATAGTTPGLSRERASYNAAAIARLGLDPRHHRHLTTATRGRR
jgi:hypothetical protein